MHYINCSKCGQGGILVEDGTTATTCPTCDKVTAETRRCVGIVQAQIDTGNAGFDGYHDAVNALLEEIISEIRGAK